MEAGADINTPGNDGNTLLLASAVACDRATTALLRAFGASWTNAMDTDPADLNARIVAMELFQGPMVWQWSAAPPGMDENPVADHVKTVLNRATTMVVRIGSESPEPMPEVSVGLSDAEGRAWAEQADHIQGSYIVSLPSDSEDGLWEAEYVYELPAEWADSGHRAIISIDPNNRLDETDENDNTATLTMDGHAVPTFEVTFVPVVFSGAPPEMDADTYMTAIGDLLPIGEYQARIGRPLDLSGRNLGVVDVELSKDTALDELLHRWNAEASETEYYHGLLVPDGFTFGFGGLALSSGKVAVSDAIDEQCDPERVLCGNGVQAHELGHNFGLNHAPGNCNETEPIDREYPYPNAGIGPRRGWVSTLDEFVESGEYILYRDLMSYCSPRFVSDYNYNKMVNHRLGIVAQPDDPDRLGPSLEIGPIPSETTLAAPSVALSATPLAAQSLAQETPLEEAAPADASNSSLAFAGVVDEFGLWSISQIAASTQAPRRPNTADAYFFTLQDANFREIYRGPLALLTPTHGATRRSWAVRVPVPELPAAFLAILDADGVLLFIERISVPAL